MLQKTTPSNLVQSGVSAPLNDITPYLPQSDRPDYLADPVYALLQSFELDKPEASFPFSARLARNCMWMPEYAHRVCEEYRKFLFLAHVADFPLTPSNDVDEAWHLHLTYTQSYWDDLCANVLGRPFRKVRW